MRGQRKICRKPIWRDGTAYHPPSRPSRSLPPSAPCPSWLSHRAETHRSRRSKRPQAPASGKMTCSRPNTLISEPARKVPVRLSRSQLRQTVRCPRVCWRNWSTKKVNAVPRQGNGMVLYRWRKAQPLTSLAANGVFVAHEHRRPREPSVVAHLLKVAGAISFSPIVRGRHRSATAFSFVLCGVSSASFVRGSHEQDSLLPAGS